MNTSTHNCLKDNDNNISRIEDGFLYIHRRDGVVLKIGGNLLKISAIEIETIINNHESIEESSAVEVLLGYFNKLVIIIKKKGGKDETKRDIVVNLRKSLEDKFKEDYIDRIIFLKDLN